MIDISTLNTGILVLLSTGVGRALFILSKWTGEHKMILRDVDETRKDVRDIKDNHLPHILRAIGSVNLRVAVLEGAREERLRKPAS